MELPRAFISSVQQLFPGEADAFIASLEDEPAISIRVNKHKHYCGPPLSKPVPWCKDGFFLDERISFARDPGFHCGSYYVQEPSSMFLDHVLHQILPDSRSLEVLDLCASPGGKSTIILSFLNHRGILIANEPVPKRLNALKENLMKWGFGNFLITQNEARDFVKSGYKFDLVLVDAPCSGEGMFRKNPDAVAHWSSRHVESCAFRQSNILEGAKSLVKPGGYLIYSTCTFNIKENEDRVADVLSDDQFAVVQMNMKEEWNIEALHSPPLGYRFLPHKVKGEGLFISILQNKMDPYPVKKSKKISKKSRIISDTLQAFAHWLDDPDPANFIFQRNGRIRYTPYPHPAINDRGLRRIAAGIEVASLKQNLAKPMHGLALSTDLSPSVNRIDLDLEQSMLYLSGTEIKGLSPSWGSGWAVVTYEDNPLGWVKLVAGTAKNHYPKSLRLRI